MYSINFTELSGIENANYRSNYLLQNSLSVTFRRCLTITLREKITRPSRDPSGPRDCNVV